jgi:hypothetical protein
MGKLIPALAVAALVVGLAAPAVAATETIKGQIIDQACYLKDKVNNTGNDHKMPADTKDCAVGCAKEGRPMALLTSDGKVYTLGGELAANNNAKIIPHISHTVEVTGDVTQQDGKATIAAAAVKMISK